MFVKLVNPALLMHEHVDLDEFSPETPNKETPIINEVIL